MSRAAKKTGRKLLRFYRARGCFSISCLEYLLESSYLPRPSRTFRPYDHIANNTTANQHNVAAKTAKQDCSSFLATKGLSCAMVSANWIPRTTEWVELVPAQKGVQIAPSSFPRFPKEVIEEEPCARHRYRQGPYRRRQVWTGFPHHRDVEPSDHSRRR